MSDKDYLVKIESDFIHQCTPDDFSYIKRRVMLIRSITNQRDLRIGRLFEAARCAVDVVGVIYAGVCPQKPCLVDLYIDDDSICKVFMNLHINECLCSSTISTISVEVTEDHDAGDQLTISVSVTRYDEQHKFNYTVVVEPGDVLEYVINFPAPSVLVQQIEKELCL